MSAETSFNMNVLFQLVTYILYFNNCCRPSTAEPSSSVKLLPYFYKNKSFYKMFHSSIMTCRDVFHLHETPSAKEAIFLVIYKCESYGYDSKSSTPKRRSQLENSREMRKLFDNTERNNKTISSDIKHQNNSVLQCIR